MEMTLNIIKWSTLGTETLIGIIINTFMVVVNLRDCAVGRSLTLVDVIIVTLGLLNILAQCILFLCPFLKDSCSGIQCILDTERSLSCLMLILEYTMFWFSTCLSVFYCLKIVNFKQPLLTRLKLRLPIVMRRLLIVGPVVVLLITAPEFYNLHNSEIVVYNQSVVRNNATSHNKLVLYREEWSFYYSASSIVIGFCMPFFLGAASSGLIISSLRKHRRQMKQNCSGFSQPNLEAHCKAAKMVLSQLLIYALFFLIVLLLRLQEASTGLSAFGISGWMVLLFLSSMSSLLLILGNSKLRRALEQMCCHPRD